MWGHPLVVSARVIYSEGQWDAQGYSGGLGRTSPDPQGPVCVCVREKPGLEGAVLPEVGGLVLFLFVI